jgi:4-hydroxythreonine-4-phosphate dehydrogenase
MSKPTIAVSVGCPSGIGPEVAVAAAAQASADTRTLLVGDIEVLRRAARIMRVAHERLREVESAPEVSALQPGEIGVWAKSARLHRLPAFGAPEREDGAAQLAWVDEALGLVQSGVARALVTGPVSKLAIATSGAPGAERFRGHTEHLAERLGAREVVMAFRSGSITTALVTTHLPLARVPEAITEEAVARASYWLTRLVRSLGEAVPRVAIAALNPHAGEGGLLGDEEVTRIAPGIARANARLAADGLAAELLGPIGAETAFRKHAAGAFHAVVAMYHDQATIPCKLTGFGDVVNVTLGLPVVRTSVDHGTGHDIAGKGEADPRSMARAMELAILLSRGDAVRGAPPGASAR